MEAFAKKLQSSNITEKLDLSENANPYDNFELFLNRFTTLKQQCNITSHIGRKTGNIIRCIFTYAEMMRSDSDYYVGNTVRELCLTRSADFILDTAELNLLIHHLCTS